MGTSRVILWLRLHASNAGGVGSTPGGGTKIPHAVWCSQNRKNYIKKKKKKGGE